MDGRRRRVRCGCRCISSRLSGGVTHAECSDCAVSSCAMQRNAPCGCWLDASVRRLPHVAARKERTKQQKKKDSPRIRIHTLAALALTPHPRTQHAHTPLTSIKSTERAKQLRWQQPQAQWQAALRPPASPPRRSAWPATQAAGTTKMVAHWPLALTNGWTQQERPRSNNQSDDCGPSYRRQTTNRQRSRSRSQRQPPAVPSFGYDYNLHGGMPARGINERTAMSRGNCGCDGV